MNIEEAEIIQLISSALECDPTSLNSNSSTENTYNWDSFGHLSVVVAIEKEYDIKIDEDNIMKLMSVQDILTYLQKSH